MHDFLSNTHPLEQFKNLPSLLDIFHGDQEYVEDFLDSLHDEDINELSISVRDPSRLMKFVMSVQTDLDDTGKALEMDN